MNYENELTRQAEMAIIGGIIMDETLLAKVIDKIQVSDFYYPYLLKSYETILYLSEIGKPIDFITVLSDLSKDNLHMQNEFKKILLDCAQSTPSLQNIEYYAEIVHKSAISREVEKTLLNIVSNGVNVESVIKDSEILIEKLSQTISCSKKETLKPINEFIENLIDYYSGKTNRIENKCDTGYPKIDSFLKGMSGGNLIILASRPKVGKTAFALSVAENVSETGKKVVFYSQEMQGIELCERILAKKSGISMNKLIDKSLLPQEIEKLKVLSSSTKNNIIINDSGGISVQDIRLNCRMIKNLGLIIIDYLQLISGSSKYAGQRQQEVSEISRSLKTMAMELNIPVIALAQLSRSVESRDDKRPILSDLRESGSIEQDADLVAFLYRDDYYHKENAIDENTSRSELLIRKNRSGPTATVDLIFKLQTSTFLNFINREES